jgi:hypothetical protein
MNRKQKIWFGIAARVNLPQIASHIKGNFWMQGSHRTSNFNIPSIQLKLLNESDISFIIKLSFPQSKFQKPEYVARGTSSWFKRFRVPFNLWGSSVTSVQLSLLASARDRRIFTFLIYEINGM